MDFVAQSEHLKLPLFVAPLVHLTGKDWGVSLMENIGGSIVVIVGISEAMYVLASSLKYCPVLGTIKAV